MNLPITFFSDQFAATKIEQLVALDELVLRIKTTTGTDKSKLPWLKCARFGDLETEKHSLRWDGNMLAISGVEADYDAEQMGFEEARDRLVEAELLAIIYTSPSHTEDTPRWRVLCPLSQEYAPEQRDRFLARLSGLFGGIFSRESWTWSQSYYFGSVNGNPSHQVALLDGVPIDQLDKLDATAIGKPVKPSAAGNGAGNGMHNPDAITDKRVTGKIESLLDNIRAAADGAKHYTLWDNALAVGGYLSLTSWSQAEAAEACVKALPSAKDWNLARKTAAQAIAAGALKPLDLEDRPGYAGRRSPEPRPWPDGRGGGGEGGPPPPEPDPEPAAEPEPDDDGPGPEWETELEAEEVPPPKGEDDDFVLPVEFSENALSYLFSTRHQDRLVYVHGWGKWFRYHEGRWHEDHTVRVYDAARAICAEQGERAMRTRKSGNKIAAIINKAACVAAIERLARHHEPQTRDLKLFNGDLYLIGGATQPSELKRTSKRKA